MSILWEMKKGKKKKRVFLKKRTYKTTKKEKSKKKVSLVANPECVHMHRFLLKDLVRGKVNEEKITLNNDHIR